MSQPEPLAHSTESPARSQACALLGPMPSCEGIRSNDPPAQSRRASERQLSGAERTFDLIRAFARGPKSVFVLFHGIYLFP
jgi:hypothetical protein